MRKISFSVCCRGHAGFPLEEADEEGGAFKAEILGYFKNGVVGVIQQGFGLQYCVLVNPLHHR